MGQKMDIMNMTQEFPVLEQLKMGNSAFIPDSFYKSLEEFCIRNAIPVEIREFNKTRTAKQICQQCLKAFIFDQAITKYHMSIDLISLAISIDAPLGHSDYYSDNGELKKI
ncbi:MAG: hypothetical protein AABX10_02480 [Nanoarchaeota archaeon]